MATPLAEAETKQIATTSNSNRVGRDLGGHLSNLLLTQICTRDSNELSVSATEPPKQEPQENKLHFQE